MRLIKTYDGITLNCDVIAMIQPVFMNSASGVISEIVNDDFNPDTLEFAITALTTFGDEVVLAVYATEEERDYARYKLENFKIDIEHRFLVLCENVQNDSDDLCGVCIVKIADVHHFAAVEQCEYCIGDHFVLCKVHRSLYKLFDLVQHNRSAVLCYDHFFHSKNLRYFLSGHFRRGQESGVRCQS